MIKNESAMLREVREKMRGGNGEVEILHIFKQEELLGKARLVAKVRLREGSSIGFHTHEQEEEIYYILSGTGQVDDDGKVSAIGPGDAILTGNGAGHAIANTGSEPLIFLAVILIYS